MYDARTGALLLDLPHPDLVVDAQFHPTANQVVTACRDGGVRVWDTSRAHVARRPQTEVLASALDHGVGWITEIDRAQLLLKDAPQDVFDAVTRALPPADTANATAVADPRAHPACYALPITKQRPVGPWSPFIENRRQQALPDPSFDDRTANGDLKAFRHTTVFRLADELTKAALTNHLSTAGPPPALETGDEDRLARIDKVLAVSVGLATDLHYYVKPRGRGEGGYRDVLAYNLGSAHRDVTGVLKDGAGIDFDRAGLEDVARRYLQGRYRSEEFDVALARALTGLEMFGFADSIRLKQEFGPSKTAQVVIIFGVALAMLTTIGALGFGLRYVILAAYEANWLGAWAGSLADILAGAFALLAVQTLWSVPVSIAQKLFGKPSGHEILRKMYHAYSEIPEYAPLSPARLRELLRDSARIGAVWPAPLYRLLDDMDQRIAGQALKSSSG